MTIDEKIQDCIKEIEKQRKILMKYFGRLDYDSIDRCNQYIEENEQLIKWLKELKTFKEKFTESLMYDHEIAERRIYENAYEKAIDDFACAIKGKLPIRVDDSSDIDYYMSNALYGMRFKVDEIAKKLKEEK